MRLQKKCGVSKSLLVRFAKHLGLSGFRELKAMLRIEEQENKVTEWNLLETMTEVIIRCWMIF